MDDASLVWEPDAIPDWTALGELKDIKKALAPASALPKPPAQVVLKPTNSSNSSSPAPAKGPSSPGILLLLFFCLY